MKHIVSDAEECKRIARGRPVIDIHTHFVPPRFEDYSKRLNVPGWPWLRKHECGAKAMIMLGDQEFRTETDRLWTVEGRFEDMERESVSRQMLSPMPIMWCYWGPPEATAEWARVQNDYIAAMVDKYPDKFVGAATLPMQSPPHAIREMERIKKIGFQVVEIGTNINGKDLDAPENVEILTAAQELGLSVFVHPWFPIGSDRMKEYYLPPILGVSLETPLTISRLILSGVLEHLTKIKMLFAHAGGAFPSLLGRLDNGYRRRTEPKKIISKLPSEYAHRLYFDSITHDREILGYMCRKYGSNRVMMGSDYPFDMGVEHPLDQVIDAGLSEADLDNVLFRTAEEFLGHKWGRA